MKHSLPFVAFRFLLGVLLLAALDGCSLYRKVHHPYRLPTPKPSPEYIAQQKEKKEAEKLRASKDKEANTLAKRKKTGKEAEEAATDISMPSDNGATANNGGSSDLKSSVYPERSTVKYNKQELMKKPKLMRRRRNKYRKGFHPIESIRNFFKYGLHKKPNYSPDHRPAPKQPSADPDEAMPGDAPAPTGKP